MNDMVTLTSFNDGSRQSPSTPAPREIRTVIQDLLSGRIFTKTRFGRKQQWNRYQEKLYITTLLLQSFQIDPISISRQYDQDGIPSDRAINGNNRLRTILKFYRNDFGIEAEENGRVYTFYYNEVPQSELDRPSRRNVVRTLPINNRNAFLNFSILFNVRERLTEKEEIDWYHQLNTAMVPHTRGHLLVSKLCLPTEVSTLCLNTFPVLKLHVEEPITEMDANSLGNVLSNISGTEPNTRHELDKDENMMLSLAIIFNLLLNGHTYDEKFHGEVVPERLMRSCALVQEIFTRATISDSFREEWQSPVPRKTYMQRFWQPRYLLGPIAWSIATEQPNAVNVWVDFLSSCQAGTIDRVYLQPIALRSGHSDDKTKTYKSIWELIITRD